MNSAACCPHCQRPLPPDAPHGLCPVCLAEVAIAPFGEESPDPLASEIRPRLGDYELLQELGRGGTGTVWRARQVSLNRHVALKLLMAPALGDDEARQRFQREAQAIAALHHPRIVQIHEVGEHEGRPFFSMELITGGNLSARLRGALPAVRQAAIWLRTLAEAVAHAHSRGIIHRDLKPANILLDQTDQPFLTDFGLAKLIGTESDLTLTGLAVGSAQYMAPEQAEGKNETVGPSADIHALGAVLYQLLTGRPPFLAGTLAATLKQVLEREPVAPHKLNPSIPRDLETICLKCLEKTTSRRYASAQELADDLDRFLNEQPIRARPISMLERSWRACRRRPLVSGLSAALGLAVLLGGAGVIVQWRKAEAANARLNASVLYAQASGAAEMVETDPLRGLAALAALLHQAPTHYAAASRLLAALAEENFILPVGALGHATEVRAACFSPDGRRIATVCAENQLRLWDAAQFKLMAGPLRFESPVARLHFTDDGRSLLIVGGAAGAEVISSETLQTQFALKTTAAISEAEFNRDGRLLLTRSTDGSATVQSVPDGRRLLVLSPEQARAAAALSPDGRFLAAAGTNRAVQVWQLPDGKAAYAPWEVSQTPTALRFAPDSLRVAIVMPRQVRIWSVSESRPHAMIGVTEPPAQVDFSPDGQRLLLIEAERKASLWNAYTGERLSTYNANQDAFPGRAFTPDNQSIVVRDGRARFCLLNTLEARQVTVPVRWPVTIRDFAISPTGRQLIVVGGVADLPVWDLSPSRTLEAWAQHTNQLRSLQFSPDGRWLVSASADHTAQLWDARTLLPVAPPLRHDHEVASARFSPDSRRALTASLDRTARLWDAQTGQLVIALLAHAAPVHVAEFSPNGKTIATITADGMLRFWNSENGQPITAPVGHAVPSAPPSPSPHTLPADTLSPTGGEGRGEGAQLMRIAGVRGGTDSSGSSNLCIGQFSPDGRRFVFTSPTGQAELWDAIAHQLVAALPHGGAVVAVAFSPDSRHVATASRDSTVRLWDAATGTPFGHPLTHESEVHCLAFGGENLLATAGLDPQPRVWNYLTGQPQVFIRSEQDAIAALAFSPDGGRLAIRTSTRTGRVRDAQDGLPLTGGLHGHPTRNLAVAFSPDGRWLVTGARGGTVRLHEMPVPTGPVSPWLLDLAEALSGARIATGGNPHADLQRLREQLRALPGDDAYARYARWFFADRATRAISPGSPVSVPEYVQRLLDDNTETSLNSAARLAPEDPRPPARLADWLASHPAKHYPRPPVAADFFRRRAAELEARRQAMAPSPTHLR